MRKTMIAASVAVLATGASAFALPALAQTTGTALAAPHDVQPTGTGSPANGPEVPTGRNPDPWEGFNRKSYNFSRSVDRIAIAPAARGYKRVVPSPVRDGVHNFLGNLGEPIVFANDVLQGRASSAYTTAIRFLGNTIFGIGGVFDVATGAGLPHHDNGFGVTLGRYGVPSGPYIYIPVLGPSTVRDGLGSGIDAASDPLNYVRYNGDVAVGVGRGVVGGLDTRVRVDDDLKQLDNTATDPYATIRSVYLQNKQAQITGGDTTLQTLPDFPGGGGAGAPAPQALPDFPAGDAGPAPGAAGGGQDMAAPDGSAPPPAMDQDAGPPPASAPPADAPPPSTNP